MWRKHCAELKTLQQQTEEKQFQQEKVSERRQKYLCAKIGNDIKSQQKEQNKFINDILQISDDDIKHIEKEYQHVIQEGRFRKTKTEINMDNDQKIFVFLMDKEWLEQHKAEYDIEVKEMENEIASIKQMENDNRIEDTKELINALMKKMLNVMTKDQIYKRLLGRDFVPKYLENLFSHDETDMTGDQKEDPK
eukprot:UN29559